MRVQLTVNGAVHELDVEPRRLLADVLRHELGMHGVHLACEQGACGACSVMLDGRLTLSCLVLAVQADGSLITTIEGLAGSDGALHPMQQAFIDQDGLQCGYCTPGQIMSAIACVREGHAGTDADIREYMSGNLCRCAAYPNIVAAIKQAREQMERP